ncbi:inositol-3-phosphate synthase [Nocardioides sp. zg-1228]|uniref:inositol-3-phosphate synthase n=1 Tax=Nocardioides sp. zg-1228 TaxID=2763008 RepID=UPI0016427B10|nr:inositol-3-phosphate synthase [Nocardioides sp. zg-1228]MBC2932633.1 inositol-3-phosphate synthase [Nocardioides sp. zg-1228]QSF58119.1 inositol-3-phosphate synthase [Nocardioides sp. zg-1228]
MVPSPPPPSEGSGPAGTLGIWFIGARGSLATTATIGLSALAAHLTDETGCVCSHPDLDARGLAAYADIVVGGHDVDTLPLVKQAERLVAGGVVPGVLARQVTSELEHAEARLRAGVRGHSGDQRADVERLAADIRDFGAGLDHVVVVDVSSTEAPHDAGPDAADWAGLQDAWAQGRAPLSTSSVYACAAVLAGAAYVAFTPSPGIDVPALRELADERGVAYAGSDGKTGETLVKSALAPMFSTRSLAVRSWTSVNLLGGGDGSTLSDPAARESKTSTKRSGLESMLGHPVPGPMHIDYVEDLGDWKTAWDHVRFDGFLGTRMTMQFTWEGCDSALAAPLVLDLARLTGRAVAVGESGPLSALGFFFKQPLGSQEHRLAQQWEALLSWSTACADRVAT